jgi:S-adenosylmethionine/arginine decarboxylase-like enzyme
MALVAGEQLVHVHILGRIGLRALVTSTDLVRNWLCDLVKRLGMRVLAGPFCEFCNEPGNIGPSGIEMLTTSHASIHCWDSFSNFDIYSCRMFDPQTAVDSLAIFTGLPRCLDPFQKHTSPKPPR